MFTGILKHLKRFKIDFPTPNQVKKKNLCLVLLVVVIIEYFGPFLQSTTQSAKKLEQTRRHRNPWRLLHWRRVFEIIGKQNSDQFCKK